MPTKTNSALLVATLRSRILLVSFFIASSLGLQASHISGATVDYTSNPDGSINVHLQVMQKCYETNIPDNIGLGYRSLCDAPQAWGQINMSLSNVSSVTSDTCSTWTPGEPCPDGDGHFILDYVGTGNLPDGCDQYRIFFRDCNRSPLVNIDNSDFPCLYLQAIVDTNLGDDNVSSSWTNANIPRVCLGEESTYQPEILNADGDSLAFSLVSGLQAPSGSNYFELDYEDGYSASEPIPGMTINPETGLLTFTINEQGAYLVVVLVEEYSNGVFQGSTMHDFIVESELCLSEPLDLQGLGLSSNGGDFNYFSFDSIVMCPGQFACGELTFDSGNKSAVIEMQHGLSEAFPDATVEVIGENPVTLSFCVDHRPMNESIRIEVDVTDNGCPVVQNAEFDFSLFMDMPMEDIELVIADEILGLVNAPEGFSYQWYRNGNYLSGETQSIIDVSQAPGGYMVEVTSTGGCTSFSDVWAVSSLTEYTQGILHLYPNPASSGESITVDHGLQEGEVFLIDASGRMIMQQYLSQDSDVLSLKGVEAGLYHLLINTLDGQALTTARIIVK